MSDPFRVRLFYKMQLVQLIVVALVILRVLITGITWYLVPAILQLALACALLYEFNKSEGA